MPLRTDALLADTMGMSAAQFGAYVRVIVAMWRNGASLPDDEKQLARIAGMSLKQWRDAWDVIGPKLRRCDAGWTQKRILNEWLKVAEKSKKASSAAQARWLKDKDMDDADALRPQCEGNATHNPVSNKSSVSSYDDTGASAEPRSQTPPAPPPSAPPEHDIAKLVFDRGVSVLGAAGTAERQARSLIGRWRREFGDPATFDAIRRAEAQSASDPIGFIVGALKAPPRRTQTHDPTWSAFGRCREIE